MQILTNVHFQIDGYAHGYCVVYSTAERSSFVEAEKCLQALWAAGHTARRAVILVGNKADLARSRIVTTDGKRFKLALHLSESSKRKHIHFKVPSLGYFLSFDHRYRI